MSSLRGDDLAYAVLDHIREHPGEWDQRRWYCGTTACFAGRAVLIAHEEDCYDGQGWLPGLEGGGLGIGFTAGWLLGWSAAQCAYVFRFFTTDFSQLEQRVKQVLNGEVELKEKKEQVS